MYIGKTVNNLNIRINGHRSAFYSVLKSQGDGHEIIVDDINCLGAHILEVHGKSDKFDFNKSYSFTILKVVDPSSLRYFEQKYIEKLKTLTPFGLNNMNSIFG